MKQTMNKQETQFQEQQQDVIPEELVQKFDGDRTLVEKFVQNGYSVEQLQESIITHPTDTDPVCTVTDKDGNKVVAGFWL